MCGFLQTLGHDVDYILTKFEQNLYCSFWEKVEKPLKKSRFPILWMNQIFYG